MINEHVFLQSMKLRLVPYLSCFTPRYHQWMTDPELLALTESEPLTLEEELENQHTWLYAQDKLTFILLAPIFEDTQIHTARGPVVAFPPQSSSPGAVIPASVVASASTSPWSAEGEWFQIGAVPPRPTTAVIHAPPPHANPPPQLFFPTSLRDAWSGASVADAWAAASPKPSGLVMIGDCNLFLLPDDEGEEGRIFEVEVMVADPHFRRRGLALEAVRLLMLYAVQVLGASGFVAKILEDNTASLRLFQDHLGFTEIKRVPVFREIHLGRDLRQASDRERWVEASRQSGCVVLGPYGAARHAELPVYESQVTHGLSPPTSLPLASYMVPLPLSRLMTSPAVEGSESTATTPAPTAAGSSRQRRYRPRANYFMPRDVVWARPARLPYWPAEVLEVDEGLNIVRSRLLLPPPLELLQPNLEQERQQWLSAQRKAQQKKRKREPNCVDTTPVSEPVFDPAVVTANGLRVFFFDKLTTPEEVEACMEDRLKRHAHDVAAYEAALYKAVLHANRLVRIVLSPEMLKPYQVCGIGVVHSLMRCHTAAPRQPNTGKFAPQTAVIRLRKGLENAARDLSGFEFIWDCIKKMQQEAAATEAEAVANGPVLHLDPMTSWRKRQGVANSPGFKAMVVPPRDDELRGVFATRSPHRPNFIGLSCVRLGAVHGLDIHIVDHDLLHGTPVLDIKPYIPFCDAHPDAKAGWVEQLDARGGGKGDHKFEQQEMFVHRIFEAGDSPPFTSSNPLAQYPDRDGSSTNTVAWRGIQIQMCHRECISTHILLILFDGVLFARSSFESSNKRMNSHDKLINASSSLLKTTVGHYLPSALCSPT
eukprot:gene10221-7164_t